MSVVSQFLQSPCDSHWDIAVRILHYVKGTPGQGVLYENRGHTKYTLDILVDTGMLDYKSVNTHMDPNVKLVPGQGEPLRDPGRYQ